MCVRGEEEEGILLLISDMDLNKLFLYIYNIFCSGYLFRHDLTLTEIKDMTPSRKAVKSNAISAQTIISTSSAGQNIKKESVLLQNSGVAARPNKRPSVLNPSSLRIAADDSESDDEGPSLATMALSMPIVEDYVSPASPSSLGPPSSPPPLTPSVVRPQNNSIDDSDDDLGAPTAHMGS